MRGPLGISRTSLKETMSKSGDHQQRTRAVVALTDRISAWLKKSGVQDGTIRATLAVGLADFLEAARTAGEHLEAMLAEDLGTPASADRALEQAGVISAYLFSEAKDHLLELEAVWESQVEERLAALGTPDASEGR
jgi:hypothetical protein